MYDPIYKELYNIKIVLLLREVEACNKSLKHGKSCGIDTLLKEYFLEAGDILLSHVTDLFFIYYWILIVFRSLGWTVSYSFIQERKC